jgi:hypothetical protein
MKLEIDQQTLAPATVRRPGSGWIMEIPVISTVHIPRAVFDNLEDIMQAAYMGEINGLGALLAVDSSDDQEPSDSPELDALLLYVARKGYNYVRLDRDGDRIGDLPQFSWDD